MKNYILILFVLAAKCFSQSPNDREIFQSFMDGKKDSAFVISKQSDGYKRLKAVVLKKKIYNRHNIFELLLPLLLRSSSSFFDYICRNLQDYENQYRRVYYQ